MRETILTTTWRPYPGSVPNKGEMCFVIWHDGSTGTLIYVSDNDPRWQHVTYWTSATDISERLLR